MAEIALGLAVLGLILGIVANVRVTRLRARLRRVS